MNQVSFDQDACAACGLCAENCTMRLIGKDEVGKPFFRTDGIGCIECGHCAAFCPKNAVSLGTSRTTEKDPTDEISFMKERLSCRSFSNAPVPLSLIEKAIDAARYAPSGKNMQPVEWTVVMDRTIIRTLGKSFREKMEANPAFSLRYKYVGEDEDPIFWGARVLVLVHGDPDEALWSGDGIIAATAFDYAANALGLGTCWSGTALNAPDIVKKTIHIAESHTLYAILMAGFPTYRAARIPPRKPARITVV